MEFEKAIEKLKPNSAPGPDGLTSGFYKCFKQILSIVLSNILNEAIKNRSYPDSMYSAIIKLLPKSENPKTASEFRPISLINTDKKFISHVLASRILPALELVIRKHQYAYLTGSNMNVAINLMRLRTSSLGKSDCIWSLDFSKAFDRLDRGYLSGLMKAVGFPPCLVELLQLMPLKTISRIEVNGFISRKFSVERGARQGDPLSALLFIFAIERLLQEIEKTPQIKSSFQQKISAYADDVVCFTKASSTETLFDIIECFCSATHLEINKSKTAVISRKNWVKGSASQNN